jgi:hypothetical protein
LYFGTSIDPPIYQLGIEKSSIVFPSPLGIGTYYWRVKAKNARYNTLGPVWKAIVSDIKSVNINTGFNGVDIANDIYNIPVLVRLDSTNYSFSKPNDLLGFRRGNDLSKILPHQIDSWNSTDKQAAVWVLVDTIKANDAKQYFYMLVDSINLASSGLDVFKTSDGFAGVWHLEESQSGTVINGVYKDATGNGYHGFDSISSPAIGGVVGMGQPFTSISDRIILPPNIPLGSSTDAITYDVWFNTYGDLSGHTLLSFTVNDGTVNRTRLEVTIQPEGNIVVSTTLQDDSLYSLTSNKFDPFFSWHHAAIVLDYVNDSAFIYIDGILNNHSNVQNLGSIETLVTSTSLIGSRPSEMIGMPNFKGIMDEVRFQHFRRSDDWIKFSYNNQKTGSTIVQIK